jgi:phosphatidylinositol alpha-1,6-mannosyltransferase
MTKKERKPRVLMLTPDFPPDHGGIQLLAHRVARGFDRFEVTVVTLRTEGAKAFDRAGDLAVRRIGAGRGRLAGNAALGIGALAEAVRVRPDLTLSFHAATSPPAAIVRTVSGAPTIQYFYANEIGHRPGLAAFAARRADAVIAISSYTASLLAACGVDTVAVDVIAPGVDLPAQPTPLKAERPTVVTIARLVEPYKGHDVLIRALHRVRAAVPEVQWVVVGDGPLRPTLEALAAECGVADCSRFLGAVSDSERDLWLRRADVFAMPSRLPGPGLAGEGFGIVYTEAGSFGKPVVAGNVGGALDAVVDGETGLMVDPTDADAVAGAVTRLLTDTQLAARMGEAGARRAAAMAWPLIAARVQQLALDVLAARPSRHWGGLGLTR